MTSEIEDFKGNKVIAIYKFEGDNYPLRMGVKKAKSVLEHLDDVKKFVEEYDTE